MSEGFYEPVSGMDMPRFSAMPTFMRLPHVTDFSAVDIALVGVPWDNGTTNRAGARHGPREIRNMSSLMRRTHHTLGICPYELCRVADCGDASVNPIDLNDTIGRASSASSPGCTRPARCRCLPAAITSSRSPSCAPSPRTARWG